MKIWSPLFKQQGWKSLFLSSVVFPPVMVFQICHLTLCSHRHKDTYGANADPSQVPRGPTLWLSPLTVRQSHFSPHLCPAVLTGQDGGGAGSLKLEKLQEVRPCVSQGSKFLAHPLSHWTLLTKHKFKDKIVKNQYGGCRSLNSKHGSFWELGPMWLQWLIAQAAGRPAPVSEGRVLPLQTSA